MDATTKERIKDLLDITSTSHDDVLDRLIAVVSQRIENFIDRPLQSIERTEDYDIKPRQRVLFLRSYPLANQAAISSVKIAVDWNFDAVTAVSSNDYRVDVDTGRLHFNFYPIQTYLNSNTETAPGAIRVVYTAGFASDTAGLISAYPAIAYACEMQVIAMWRRRDEPMQKSVRIDEYGSEVDGVLKFLPDVREALIPYRRMRFGQ
jgi:hypothetical protein